MIELSIVIIRYKRKLRKKCMAKFWDHQLV